MKIIIIALVILSLFLDSCEKTISIQQPAYTSRLSIECGLEAGKVPELYLYKTIQFFSTDNVDGLFVKNAEVKISSTAGDDLLSLDSVYNYLKCRYDYLYKGKSLIVSNKRHHLTLISDSITYTASTTTNISPVTIDSVGYTDAFKDIYGEHEGVIPYFHDIPNQSNYYRFEMTRTVDTTMQFNGIKIGSLCIGNGSV
ncbi:MAG TPA: DUF4249 family protein, partial [Ignavibacteriaceae bacterium]|nr:DUF4249 family protein [Ignavibacteriaceae bacterium]